MTIGRFLPVAALAVLAVGSVQAQDLSGTWQGTLNVGRELRLVIKVEKSGSGGLTGQMYSIDQGGLSVQASAITVQDQNVKMMFPGLGAGYEGKLAADANAIAGNWSQGPKPVPLNLVRATADTEWTIPKAPPQTRPMALNADARFSVATIKPSRPEAKGRGFTFQGRRFLTMNTTLADMMAFTYRLQTRQLIGLPGWATTDHYDVVAEPDTDSMPGDPQIRRMMEHLLAERFGLRMHKEQRELNVYAIRALATPHKLTANTSDPNGLPGLGFRALGSLAARNATIADFAGTMQNSALDRPVIDQTGIQGRYDFMLEWAPDEFQFTDLPAGVPKNEPGSKPDLFTAIQQQLGLKLEATKAQADVIVVDQATKPSEN